MGTGVGLLNADFVAANLIGGKSWEPLVDVPLALPGLVMQRRAFHDYRTWTLEQLALTTTYLLGPTEPMLAGETTMFAAFPFGTITRDFAVVVTASHVLVLRIDSVDGQPRWVALAARPSDVTIYPRNGLFGFHPTLVVVHRNWQWLIRGEQRVFEPDPVLQAWRHASSGPVPVKA